MALGFVLVPLIIAIAMIASSLPRITPWCHCRACGYDRAGLEASAPCSECGAADRDERFTWRRASRWAIIVRVWTPPVAVAGLALLAQVALAEPIDLSGAAMSTMGTGPLMAAVYAGSVRLTEPLYRRWAWTWSLVSLLVTVVFAAAFVLQRSTAAGMYNGFTFRVMGGSMLAMVGCCLLTIAAAIDLRFTQRRAPGVRSWPPG